MAQQQSTKKGGKNAERGARLKSRTQNLRPHHILQSRKRHLKNARRSCGEKFAEQLQLYYARIGVSTTPPKCKRSKTNHGSG